MTSEMNVVPQSREREHRRACPRESKESAARIPSPNSHYVIHENLDPSAASIERWMIQTSRINHPHLASPSCSDAPAPLSRKAACICEHHLAQPGQVLIRNRIEHSPHNGQWIKWRLVIGKGSAHDRTPWTFRPGVHHDT